MSKHNHQPDSMTRLIGRTAFILIGAVVFTAVFTVYAPAFAKTVIEAQVVRNQEGSGTTLISSGFPLPPGLVTEQMINDRLVRVFVDGSEVPAAVVTLKDIIENKTRGVRPDGSLRSMLIQFDYAMDQGEVLPARVVIDDGTRTYADPPAREVLYQTVIDNNVILPSDPEYIVTTEIYGGRKLLPKGKGTETEEKLYTELADNRFDHLIEHMYTGTARYEPLAAILGLWARSGDIKYWNGALKVGFYNSWFFDYMTPSPNASCRAGAMQVANPYDRDPGHSHCGIASETHAPMHIGHAMMFLMTGWHDFWGNVAYHLQGSQNQPIINSTESARENAITPQYNFRFNYGRYGAALSPAGFLINAMPDPDFIEGDWFRDIDIVSQAKMMLDALEYHEWDIMWIPFENGSGTPPGLGTTISQGDVSAETTYVFDYKHQGGDGNQKPYLPSDDMPSTGYIQIIKSSLTGGSFTAGPITGIDADATGPEEDDYRNGMVGVRSYARQEFTLPIFQASFPCSFLIDYWLHIDEDIRIPEMVKTIVDAVLLNINERTSDEPGSDTWGKKTHGHSYGFQNPPGSGVSSWTMPMHARSIAFVLMTHGVDEIVNGKTYTEWYDIFINTANVAPSYWIPGSSEGLTWEWKNFGQFYGWDQDAPWMMEHYRQLYGNRTSDELRPPTNLFAK